MIEGLIAALRLGLLKISSVCLDVTPARTAVTPGVHQGRRLIVCKWHCLAVEVKQSPKCNGFACDKPNSSHFKEDLPMPNTIVAIRLPESLRDGNSALVKLAGKIDSFSLLLRETPEGELKRSIEVQFHSMVFATRKEIRKYCPRYRSLPGEGILDFNTDCTSGQLEPGDLGQAPPPKRGRLCEKCCFFAGIPEENDSELTVSAAPQDLLPVASSRTLRTRTCLHS
jgi:hypothetical protein